MAIALLALPGCASEVLVSEPDGPAQGLFTVGQTPPNRAFAGATFFKIRGEVDRGPTEIDRDGACWLDHYEPPDEPSPIQLVQVDAGEVRVTGGLTDLTATFENGGYVFPEKGAIFEAGDVLTLDVEGSDDVPPMSVTLAAPPLLVISPAPATIDTSEDIVFTWTSPPGTGTLTIQVQGYWPAVQLASGPVWGPRDIVRCQVPLSDGTLTMPASLLSQVSDDGPHGASVSARVTNHEVRTSGDTLVGFSVGTDAATPSGKAYHFDAPLK